MKVQKKQVGIADLDGPMASFIRECASQSMDAFVGFEEGHLTLSCFSMKKGVEESKELLSCPVDKKWAVLLNKTPQLSVESIYCHEEPHLLKKIAKGEKLTWGELYRMVRLAELGKPSAMEVLNQPLSNLVGSGEIDKTAETLISAKRTLPHLERFWPNEWIDTFLKIYQKVLPWIVSKEDITYHGSADPLFAIVKKITDNQGERHLQNRARELIASISMLAVKAIKRIANEKLAAFVLKEILQKPNPENTAAIRTIITSFNRLPFSFRQRAVSYLSKEYDLGVAKEHTLSYPGATPIFPDILVFLYRRIGRADARLELENQMLQELALHETGALSLYLKEIVVIDKDPAAVHKLKTILVGGGRLPFSSLALLLRELLSLENNVFERFKTFLMGQETVTIVQNGNIMERRFDIRSFFSLMEPFPILSADDSRLVSRDSDFFPPESWNSYHKLIDTMMQRAAVSKEAEEKLFAAVQVHLDNFYSDLDRQKPPWSPWRSELKGFFPLSHPVTNAMAYPPMRDYLWRKVRQGDPFLGYEALARANGAFRSTAREEHLDAVYERMRIELEPLDKDRDWFPMKLPTVMNQQELVSILHAHDVGRSEQFLIRGLEDGDPKVRYTFLALAMAANLRSPDLAEHLSAIDLSFILEMAERHSSAGYDSARVVENAGLLLNHLAMHWDHPRAAEVREELVRILQ